VQYNHDRLIIVKRRVNNRKITVLSSRRNVVSDGAFLTVDGKLFHAQVPKPLERHGRQALNVWWTVPPAWLCQQNADGVQCQRQMSDSSSVNYVQLAASREFLMHTHVQMLAGMGQMEIC